MLVQINNKLTTMGKFAEGLAKQAKKQGDAIENNRDDMISKFSLMKEDYIERFGDFDKINSEQFEEMGETINQVKVMARDSVNAKEKELTDLMEKNVDKIKTFVDTNIEDMIEERRTTLAKYEKQFN